MTGPDLGVWFKNFNGFKWIVPAVNVQALKHTSKERVLPLKEAIYYMEHPNKLQWIFEGQFVTSTWKVRFDVEEIWTGIIEWSFVT